MYSPQNTPSFMVLMNEERGNRGCNSEPAFLGGMVKLLTDEFDELFKDDPLYSKGMLMTR